jgi:hypothetical protein
MSAPAAASPPGGGALPGRLTPAACAGPAPQVVFTTSAENAAPALRARAGRGPHRACEQNVAALGPDLRQVRL